MRASAANTSDSPQSTLRAQREPSFALRALRFSSVPRSNRLFVMLAVILLVALGGASVPMARAGSAPPIKHMIVVIQDNHSFDNYFGTYEGADGIDPESCVPITPDSARETSCVRPFPLAGRTIEPINYTRRTFEQQVRGGRMDGFVAAFRQVGKDGSLALGYYDDHDIPFYWNLADNYVLFDRFFSAAAGGSVPNRMFALAAVAGSDDGRTPEGGWGDSIPTIFDRLEKRGVPWKVYVESYHTSSGEGGEARLPLLAFPRFRERPELARKIVDLDELVLDLQRGTLPAVAYVLPTGSSERPPSSVQRGQRLVKGLLNELMRSDAWWGAAFFLIYDDAGGWYDHVAPPTVDGSGYGLRVPALLVSPYARKGFIDSTTLDSTSLLRLIEDLHGLQPLAERDGRATSPLGAFDFSQQPRPPAFVSFEREVVVKKEPRRDVIYLSYGSALIIAGLLLAGCALAGRAKHNR